MLIILSQIFTIENIFFRQKFYLVFSLKNEVQNVVFVVFVVAKMSFVVCRFQMQITLPPATFYK